MRIKLELGEQWREITDDAASHDAVRDNECTHVRNGMLEKVNNLHMYHDQTIERLESEFETAHTHYVNTTSERFKQYIALTDRDSKYNREIAVHMRQVQRVINGINQWRRALIASRRVHRETNQDVLNQIALATSQYRAQRDHNEAISSIRNRALKSLVTIAQLASKQLKQRLKHATNVLQLAQRVNGFSHNVERFGDFVDKVLNRHEIGIAIDDSEKNEIDAPATDVNDGNKLKHGDEMRNYAKRYSKALLSVKQLKVILERKRSENARLKQCVKQYAHGLIVDKNTFAPGFEKGNTLFLVNKALRHSLSKRAVTSVKSSFAAQ